MASIFTYDHNPPRVSSPWSTPGRATPQPTGNEGSSGQQCHERLPDISTSPTYLSETGITRLEAEPHEGSTEYKLHLLLRPRRNFCSTSTSNQIAESQQPSAYLSKAGLRSTSLTPSNPIPPPTTQNKIATADNSVAMAPTAIISLSLELNGKLSRPEFA